jgi:glutamate--cysteine ligase
VPTKTRQLDLPEARALIADCGFGGAGRLPGDSTVGVELESFTVPLSDPGQLPRPTLPGGSRLTFEPGGQVELSSLPMPSVGEACEALSADLDALRRALMPLGVQLVQSGLAPSYGPRLADGPRYRAMEAYFDSAWPEGRTMMRASASVQVNLGLGGPAEEVRRWQAANRLGPLLAACFACSPVPGRWSSQRLATWLCIDRGRTAPVGLGGPPGEEWADYALDARVMFIRTDGDAYVPLGDQPLVARQWIEAGHPLGWPTADDLAYHLTTLFPPVRPKGWLELRMIDALPDPWWRVPVAVAAAWIDDQELADSAGRAANRWWEAARRGLADPVLNRLAAWAAGRGLAGLDRVGTDPHTADLAEQWAAAVVKGGVMPWL